MGVGGALLESWEWAWACMGWVWWMFYSQGVCAGKGERFKEYPKLQELIRLKVSDENVRMCVRIWGAGHTPMGPPPHILVGNPDRAKWRCHSHRCLACSRRTVDTCFDIVITWQTESRPCEHVPVNREVGTSMPCIYFMVCMRRLLHAQLQQMAVA